MKKMVNRSEWKFYVMLIIAAAGVGVPFFIRQMDLSARSLQLQIVSQTPLTSPDITDTVSGLTLSIDGIKIEQPYLTILKFTNNGSDSILATDFEEPLQIFPDGNVKLVRVQLGPVRPADLQPKVSFLPPNLLIKPMLLNPEDTITFAVVTSGGKSNFTARSRIKGIKSVTLEDKSEDRASAKEAAFRFVIGVLLAFSFASWVEIFVKQLTKISIVPFGISALGCGFGASFFMLDGLDRFGHSLGANLLIIFSCYLLSALIHSFLDNPKDD